MKIYDCFTFFNELDLLEIRLSELYDYVDYFVIVEATQTFSGSPKKLIFKENEKRYKKYLDKIIYISTDMPRLTLLDRVIINLMDSKYLPRFRTNSLGLNGLSSTFGIGRWKYVFYQRNKIIEELKNASDGDVIIYGDLDEIPNKEKVPELRQMLTKYDYIYFRQKMFFYFLNGLAKMDKWTGTKCCLYKTLKEGLKSKISHVRDKSAKERLFSLLGYKRKVRYIEDGGWHFTYLGDLDRIYLKTKSVAESINFEKTKEELSQNIKEGIFKYSKDFLVKIHYIPLDKTFPNTILKNKKRYKHLIRET